MSGKMVDGGGGTSDPVTGRLCAPEHGFLSAPSPKVLVKNCLRLTPALSEMEGYMIISLSAVALTSACDGL